MIFKEFLDIFPHEILGMPPPKKIAFYIDLAPAATSISKAPSKMVAVELNELEV